MTEEMALGLQGTKRIVNIQMGLARALYSRITCILFRDEAIIYRLCYARMLQTMSNYALGVFPVCPCSKLVKTVPPQVVHTNKISADNPSFRV